MSSATVDKLINQARGLPEAERSTFYESLISALYTSTPTDCIPGLRHLHLLIHATRTNRRYPHQLLDALVKNILVPEKLRWLPKLMSALILQELAPSADINLPMGNLPWDENQVPYVLMVALNQGLLNEELLQNLVPKLVKWLSTVGVNCQVQTHSLAVTEAVQRLYPHLLSKEHLHVVNCQLSEWLRNASLHQAPNPYARAIFRKEADQQPAVSEVDGVITKNFFTVLCIGQYYTSDQLLNIHTFSNLRSWLMSQSQLTFGDESHTFRRSISRTSSPMIDDASIGSSSRSSGSLEETSLQYALRIIDQSERKPKVPQDGELQHASLIEAISILDHLCICDSTLVPKVFETIKRVYNRASASQPRVVLKLLQFFLNHAESVVYDASQVYDIFFKKTLTQMYVNAAVTFDVVLFLRDNLEALCYKTDLLQKYFPNILKIIAWNPRTYITEFVELLPAFLTPTTSLEVLHTLLDLPCLTASLELLQQSLRSGKSDLSASHIPPARTLPPKVIQKFKDPMYRPVFKFMLREDGGHGDTIDRLGRLHELISELVTHPRVVKCSEAVPVLLTVLFEVVIEAADKTLATNLIPVLLERSGVLYNIPAFQTEVKKVLSDAWVSVIKKYPVLIVSQSEEILEFVGSSTNIVNREDFFIHVVWSVGEYFSPHYSERCTSDQISSMYETLEILAYEVPGRFQIGPSGGTLSSAQGGASKSSASHSARLVTSLMSTLAKLASRSQDLIPRVILCLSKLSQVSSSKLLDGTDGNAIEERASELISLLKLPNIASAVLNPSPELEKSRWPLESTSLPVILQVTTDMLRTPEAAPS